MSGYVYLFKDRELARAGKNVYKIGKSAQLNPLKFHEAGYELIIMIKVDNYMECQKNIIEKLGCEFGTSYGKKSFEGDVHKMCCIIVNHISFKPEDPVEPEDPIDTHKTRAIEKLKTWLESGIKPVNTTRTTKVFSNYPVCDFDGDNTLDTPWDARYDSGVLKMGGKYAKPSSDPIPTPKECTLTGTEVFTWFDIAVQNNVLIDYIEHGIYIDEAPDSEVFIKLRKIRKNRGKLRDLKVHVVSSQWILSQKNKPEKLKLLTLVS